MLRHRTIALALMLALIAGCGYGDDEASGGGRASTDSPAAPTFDSAAAIIETDGEPVLIDVEVAQTEEQRAHGLMHRRSLAADSGMAFIFFEPTSAGFWMKDTLIPLSIGFFDESGAILRILDMDPCRRDPCKVYSPGVTYQGALEVNQGAFDDWGVEEGDTFRMKQ